MREFKGMVKALHRAGIEVILDVVYNHTAEGNHLGPMLSFRGVDNESYYRLVPDDPRFYMDFTGTGNSLNPVQPSVLRLIMDSLRYWVIDCHVDGFRFDLAIGAGPRAARRRQALGLLRRHPPGPDPQPGEADRRALGRRAGRLPGGQLPGALGGVERDLPRPVRDFWRGQGSVGDFAGRFTGSSDLYQPEGRPPHSSINFITAHDGFTMRDLVSYNEKHNESNYEGNDGGSDDDRSWNSGAEGPTDDPAIEDLRCRRQRSMLATLLLSQGVPMLLGGDEMARTQEGNNNTWCLDTAQSWFDWDLAESESDLVDFTRRLIKLRAAHPVLRRAHFLTGDEPLGSGLPDAWWFRPDGLRMTRRNWEEDGARCLGVFLNGWEIPGTDDAGERITDDSFLILFNAGGDAAEFRLPTRRFGAMWTVELTTAEPERLAEGERVAPRGSVPVPGWSVVILRRVAR